MRSVLGYARLLGFTAPEGMTITYALIQMVEKISERSDLARIINKAGSSHIMARCPRAV